MLRIIHISDTHGMHRRLPFRLEELHYSLKSLDESKSIKNVSHLLIHSGDFSNHGNELETIEFFQWFSNLPFKYKICIGGNHDLFLEWLVKNNKEKEWIAKNVPSNVIYLNENSVEIKGFKFYGSPYQPEFCNWAFNVQRGPKIQLHWDKIPGDTDILITHGPAMGYVDEAFGGPHVGCANLRTTIEKLNVSLHLAGHIHQGYGLKYSEGKILGKTIHVNSSICNEAYQLVNKPHIFEVDKVDGKILIDVVKLY